MQELINAKIKEMTENGKLDEIVTKSASQFIQNMVNDVLSSYGDVASAYKSKLLKNVMDGFEKLDFIQYSKTLTDLVEAELNKSVVENAIQPVKEMIKRFTGELDKKEWKLSEIMDKFKEDVMQFNNDEAGEIKFSFQTSDYGSAYIYFDEDHSLRNGRGRCKYSIFVDTETKKIFCITVDEKGLHPLIEMGALRGFDLFLFKLHVMGCTIILDHERVETEWYKNEY